MPAATPGQELLCEAPPAAAAEHLRTLLAMGGFPEPLLAGSDRTLRRWQRNRLDRFFREDVRDLEALRDLSLIEQLADALPERVGSLLSLNALREDLEVSHRAVTHWMGILERLYHVVLVRPFPSRRFAGLKKMPKAYLWDWSLVPDRAARFENMLALHLLKFCHLLHDRDGHRPVVAVLQEPGGHSVGLPSGARWRSRLRGGRCALPAGGPVSRGARMTPLREHPRCSAGVLRDHPRSTAGVFIRCASFGYFARDGSHCAPLGYNTLSVYNVPQCHADVGTGAMTTRFINRAVELKVLAESWRAPGAQLLVILGRRRIGKTALLRHFAREHPSIVHFVATRLPEAQQLAELGEAVGAALGDPILAENGFRDWRQVTTTLVAGRSRLALIIDEFPYLVDANPALPSLLQRAWDDTLSASQAWLVLCGSSVAMMERDTLNARAPLFGRRTGQLRLRPLAFDAVQRFAPSWDFDDAVRAFAVFGGIPQYLQLLDETVPLIANVDRLVVAPGAPLRDEVEFLLRQELVDTRVYFGILAAIAAGHHKFGEIVNATHLAASHVTKYLAVLQSLGLVARDVPASEANPEKSKRGLYRIGDPFVRFWFRHVRRHWSRLESGQADGVLRGMEADLDHLAEGAYEDLCRDLVRSGGLAGHGPWERAGRFWDARHEIDIVAFGERNEILVGEAKWSRRAVGTNLLVELEDKVARTGVAAGGRGVTYALFSRSGFTPALERVAQERSDVLLVERLGMMNRPASKRG